MKKVLSVFLSLVMLLSITTGMTITAEAATGSEIVAYARQFIGYPYVYGTQGPNSFDCSGFVQYVFKHFGISLPASSSSYWNNPTAYGTVVGTGSTANAKAGDLISWSGHVAIYTENGKCVEALNANYGVTESVPVNSHTNGTNYKVIRINGVTSSSSSGGGYKPQGCVDVIRGETGRIYVAGWAFDKDDTSKSLTIHVYIGGPAGTNGAECHAITANQTRTDVNSAYGISGNHGFGTYISTAKTSSQGVYIYALNTGAGSDNPQIGSGTANITKDTTKPTISNAKISNVTLSGYTVTFTATDNIEVAKVQCPTWTGQNGQDDLNWNEKVTKSGNNYTCNIKVSDHKNETGDYYTHIYVYDVAGNEAKTSLNSVNILKTVQNNCSHTYTSSVTKSSTCTSTGTRTYNCTKCGYNYTSTINKAEHKWNSGTTIKSPTYIEMGIKEYKCTVCGETKTEAIEKLPAQQQSTSSSQENTQQSDKTTSEKNETNNTQTNNNEQTTNKTTSTAKKISLSLKKVTVKKSAKKLVLKATLKINGKPAKNKKVTFKFNGKKYKVKTNKKGVAKVTIKKSVLKKLKKGKKVTYSVTYGKKTVKRTVKVKK